MKHDFKTSFLLGCLTAGLLAASASAEPSASTGPSASASGSGDPYVDELLTNGCESQSPYWLEVKEQLTNGNIEAALKLCRKTLLRRELDIDMHCLYAMALEMKYRRISQEPALFDECVREWAHVAKARVISASRGWDHVGDGEVFTQNQERKEIAQRHLQALVGRAPKYFESEQSFIENAVRIRTEVAGSVKDKDKQL